MDFSQYADDHAHLFVFVTALGETSGALYGAVVDYLQESPPVTPRGAKDSLVFLRLANRLPRWARDWPLWRDFQPYKRVLGLLAVTQCHDAEDVIETTQSFKDEKRRFFASLGAARCIVFGSTSELEPACLPDDFSLVEFDNSRSFTKPEVELDTGLLRKVVTDLATALFGKIETRIDDLVRKIETGARLDPLLFLRADGKEGESEEDAKLSRTQKIGRTHKHIADLHLLCGQLQPACDHFSLAITQLSRDPLWEGSANEGLGATLVMKKRRELLGQKTAELSIPSNVFGGFLKVPQRILKASQRKRGLTDVGATAVPPDKGVVSNGRASSSVYRRPKSPLGEMNEDSLDSIEEDGIDGEMDGGEEGGIKADGEDEETRKLLQKDLVVDRFTRAELHYRKAGANGGVSRIELLFKFARYLVSQERHKAATEILQKIYGTIGLFNAKDKISLCQAMSRVFVSMGYHRKASYLLHLAALHTSHQSTRMQDHYEVGRRSEFLIT
jgi:hypothetical protein